MAPPASCLRVHLRACMRVCVRACGHSPHRNSCGAVGSALGERLARGEPTQLEGEHPRTLYTVAVGQNMSCGEESIDAGSEVPWHAHQDSEEEDFLPGVSVLVPKTVPHRIVNLSKAEALWLSWTLSPPLQVQQFKAGHSPAWTK
uniref:Cupin 2 conserved barrel domain-containing protein n=1 Tax=Alexandrium monilatum TaxID=311494 RepID=A0A7S4W9X2_9DINO